ncbi:hypothetical protein GCM10020295_48840 [Streptomyces cinereospinus]
MSLQDRTQAVPRAAAPPQKDGKPGLALLVIAAAQLMLVLDNTIVAVALPSMQSALGLSEAGLGWVVTAYALAFGGLLLAAAAPVTCSAAGWCSGSGWSSSPPPPCSAVWPPPADC